MRVEFLVAALLLAGCAPHPATTPPGAEPPTPIPASEYPTSSALKAQIPPDAAFDIAVAAVQREKFPVSASSKAGLVVHTDWVAPDHGDPATQRMRFDITISPGLCLVRAEAQALVRGAWKDRASLDAAGHATLVRLTGDLQGSLAAAAGEGYPPAGAPTPSEPKTSFAAAQRAVENAGLHVERALEAAGLIETSWRDVEQATLAVPLDPDAGAGTSPAIHFRVRYVVQVSGKNVSARSEIEKSTDERSWVKRAKMTKSEEQQLDKLRHAIREELDALEARGR